MRALADEHSRWIAAGRDGDVILFYMITQSSRTERAYIAWREISDTPATALDVLTNLVHRLLDLLPIRSSLDELVNAV